MELTKESKVYLLKLARNTIENKLFGAKKKIEIDVAPKELKEVAGLFVTLHKKGALRGCIGNIVGFMPLIEGVQKLAASAAFDDPRFPSLTQDEYKDIDLEITVLSPLKESSVDEIILGKHGVVITKEFNKGLLLPQVPIEHNMDKDTFLSHTCLKAGLPKDAWKNDSVKIETFTGIIFSEKELKLF